MIERIVVGYDGSEPAQAGFSFGVALAEATGASVLAMYCIEPEMEPVLLADPAVAMDPMLPPAMGLGDGGRDEEAEREWAATRLAALEQSCAGVGVAFDSMIERGTVIDALADEAGPKDVIVVGRHGRFRRGGVGSTTKALVKSAPCPVAVVGEQATAIGRIVVAFDGSDVAHRAIRFGQSLARDAGWPLTVLAIARGAVTMDKAAAEAAAAAPQADVIPLGQRGQSEADLITQHMQQEPTGVLCIGAYADNWLHELLLGSVTGRVLSHLAMPAILVHGRP